MVTIAVAVVAVVVVDVVVAVVGVVGNNACSQILVGCNYWLKLLLLLFLWLLSLMLLAVISTPSGFSFVSLPVCCHETANNHRIAE